MTTPNEALRTILPIAGCGDTRAADVMFTGGADPVLPTPFRIGAAGAATLAASGLAATELWQVRTGRRQRVTVDLRQATAALRSGRYLQLAPPPPSCSTGKSWLHFRPPPVDFCCSRLAIGAATERARAPASAPVTRALNFFQRPRASGRGCDVLPSTRTSTTFIGMPSTTTARVICSLCRLAKRVTRR